MDTEGVYGLLVFFISKLLKRCIQYVEILTILFTYLMLEWKDFKNIRVQISESINKNW